jgi:hypothetical protein
MFLSCTLDGVLSGFVGLSIGSVMLVMIYQSLSEGILPFAKSTLYREENPVWYWAVFCLYTLVGVGMTIYALLLLFGVCPPPPVRLRRH